jgi:predicted DNA-binding transcriptional regulator YafY
MKIDRLLAILLYLQCRDKVTARELGAYFGVTLRTIYRDMDALCLAGVPVVSFQGMEGGYGLVETFRLDRTFLKEEELLSLLTALKGINAAIKDKAIEGVLLKLRALAAKGNTTRDKAEALPETIYVPIPWGVPQRWSDRLEEIRNAIGRRRVISFTYTKSDGASASRRVEPLTLVLQSSVWYLYAWDLVKKAYRFFRISRLSDLKVEEGFPFVRKPGQKPFPWEAEWEAGRPIEIRLRFSPHAAQKALDAYPWEAPQAHSDGSLTFTMKVPYGDWMDSQILSFGPEVEVVSPDWVRQRIGELAQKMAAQHGRVS